MTSTDHTAREALRLRQGKGARYDAPNAPAADLLMARRGTAFFARKLNELTDAELAGPAGQKGWTQAHVIADLSYRARHQSQLLEALHKGLRHVPSDLEEEQFPEVDLAATLPARALRHLFQHSEVHLNVCWRDLGDAGWDSTVTTPQGQCLAARALPGQRAHDV